MNRIWPCSAAPTVWTFTAGSSRRIVTGVRTLFGTGPFFVLALEIGAGQGAAVGSLIRRAYPDRIEALSVEKDLAGLDRNVMAVLRTK
jgi:release factor glutamine methyltransferase